ncbi:MAG: hypothetical protein RIR11_1391 [Bacteroidota bacterium]
MYFRCFFRYCGSRGKPHSFTTTLKGTPFLSHGGVASSLRRRQKKSPHYRAEAAPRKIRLAQTVLGFIRLHLYAKHGNIPKYFTKKCLSSEIPSSGYERPSVSTRPPSMRHLSVPKNYTPSNIHPPVGRIRGLR